MNTEQRVAIGKSVREFMQFIGEQPSEFWEEFATEMKRRDLLQSAQPESPLEDMNTLQAQKFELIPMPFGIHKDELIKNIPLSYLCNLLDPNDFTKKLRKYVAYRMRGR